ncbi:hypothetical protein R9C00_24490 [Flammeovirgaceae bacterium SG7u.111]|nr:hypothetical protein [Flammeovirgaceae bacterium SG7u.132]WPO34857.1 hypothetical protein R9C00_24490 [Flammeovirgaceae bacterium SG7u.111]
MNFRQSSITEETDQRRGRFYLSLHRKKPKGLISNKEDVFDFEKAHNIAVFDIHTNQTKYLFDNVKEGENITHLLFETGFDEEYKCIVFNRRSSKIQNNEMLEKRELFDVLIVCQEIEASGLKRIWRFKKDGSEKSLITEVDTSTEWRLDVFHKKVITFKRSIDSVEFDSYEY